MFARLTSLLITVAALIVGIVLHECSHAAAAWALGDHTAGSRGRMSLNPFNHIDPFGTILLPLIMVILGGPVFAYAKPVPIHLNNLKNPQRDEVLIALAGPTCNLILAVIAAIVLHAIMPLVITEAIVQSLLATLASFAARSISINLSLAFFNLIPLPPLDGSSILVLFLKGKALNTYYTIQQYSMPILIIVLYLLPSFLRIDLIGIYFSFTVYPIGSALLSWALF